MNENETEIAVVGAGRIGLPWAAVLASELDRSVTCIDIDKDRVREINHAESPFAEPELESALKRGVESGRLRASTEKSPIDEAEYVAITLNAPRRDMESYRTALEEYATHFRDGQTVILRTTLPIDMVGRSREIVAAQNTDVHFTVFPERLAEGQAIEEIKTLPKIVGVDSVAGKEAVTDLLDPLGCPIRVTDPETAMFVKLIDNTYRDAVFAIANQIAYTADQLGLNAHGAIDLANFDYPRNDIPKPGTVGGKCLPKDPHFLTDERVCDQPTTPDLFNSTRRTNAYLPSYIVQEVLMRQPGRVGMLGLAYKKGVGDTFASPAVAIADSLESQGVGVAAFDPHVDGFHASIEDALTEVDGAIIGVNHAEFQNCEPALNQSLSEDAFVYDIWGILDATELTPVYDGLGISESRGSTESTV